MAMPQPEAHTQRQGGRRFKPLPWPTQDPNQGLRREKQPLWGCFSLCPCEGAVEGRWPRSSPVGEEGVKSPTMPSQDPSWVCLAR